MEEEEESTGVEIDEALLASYSNPKPVEEEKQEEEQEPAPAAVAETPSVAATAAANAYENEPLKQVLSEETNTNLDQDFNDAVEDMTYGRRIARALSKYRWYNPRAKKDSKQSVATDEVKDDDAGGAEEEVVEVPSLDSAWTYYEHYSLPRHLLRTNHSTVATSSDNNSKKCWDCGFLKQKPDMLRAKYGERDEPTRLYNVLTTPESEFSDFGIGLATYFWTVRVLGFILLLAGFINIPSMVFFASTNYSELGQSNVSSIGVVGSAICTDQVWRACPTCSRSDWSDFPVAYERFASTGSLNFILRNECRIRLSEGIVALVSLCFMCISIYIMGKVSSRREVRYDEAQQTTPDYSLEVENPPKDAKDADEWRGFFSQFGENEVVFCTIALDNEKLLRELSLRRKFVEQIESLVRPGVRFDKDNLDEMVEHCFPVPCWRKLFLWESDASSILKNVRKKEALIKDLATEEQHASNVFVTFQTEQAQRRALKALSFRRLDIWTNASSRIPANLLFRGEHVLAVKEPPEPSSVRWQDLDDSNSKKFTQIFMSTIVSLGAVAAGAVLIALARRRSAVLSAIVISILNQVTPYLCRYINNKFESHSSDGSRQASLYIKMTFFRWVNTVIVLTITLSFADSLSDGEEFLVSSVYAIFFSELLVSPIFVLTDAWGNFQRHFLGPRAPDQKRMNLKFRGGYFQLSERFTNVTKILFMTLFYAPFYPNGFFFSAITLFVVYWMDKFCLFRIWGRAPKIGTEVAEFSRSYFFSLSLAAYALMLSYNYAGWPFDNACESDTAVSDEYVGSYGAVDGNGVPVTISIEAGDVNYYFCLQDMFRFKDPIAFPALARFQPAGFEWMTSDQEKVSNMLGLTCVVVLFLVALLFFNRIIVRWLRSVFTSRYKPCGEATDIGFTEVEEKLGYHVVAYVPQIVLPQFEFPLLACDVSGIDHSLIGWEDTVNGMDSHNLIYDIPGLADTKEPLFSIVKQWNVDGQGGEKDPDAKEEPASTSEVNESVAKDASAKEQPAAEADEPVAKHPEDEEENANESAHSYPA